MISLPQVRSCSVWKSNDVCIFRCFLPNSIIIILLYPDPSRFICRIMMRVLSQRRPVYNYTSIKCIIFPFLYDLLHGPTARFGGSNTLMKCTYMPLEMLWQLLPLWTCFITCSVLYTSGHYFSASGIYFCSRLSKPQGIVRPEELGKLGLKPATFRFVA
jgi:hypothetical protein